MNIEQMNAQNRGMQINWKYLSVSNVCEASKGCDEFFLDTFGG